MALKERTPLKEALAPALKSTQGAKTSLLDVVERVKRQKKSKAFAIKINEQVDVGLDNFVHDPHMLDPKLSKQSSRRQRSRARRLLGAQDDTLQGGLQAIVSNALRKATVFRSARLCNSLLFHLVVFTVLAIMYYIVDIDAETQDNFVPGIKDFADLCA